MNKPTTFSSTAKQMIGKNPRQNAFLRLVSREAVSSPESRYPLLSHREMVMGRDPSCQVVLDAITYRMVSRRHAVVRPLSPESKFTWTICDLNSANGTFLNGQLLREPQELQHGDRISLGYDGPQFVFECETIPVSRTFPVNPATVIVPGKTTQQQSKHDGVSFTQLFPIISTGKDLTRKAYLIPGILTVIFVVFNVCYRRLSPS